MPPETPACKLPAFAGSQSLTLSDREYEAIRLLVKEKTGISLGLQKKDLVISRLARRLRALGLTSFGEYLRVLRESPDGEELVHMINRITTNKTEFFRGRQHFNHISQAALPALCEACEAAGERTLMAWSAACSSGEEPYSLAMTLAEFFEGKPGWRFRILATDLDTAMLTKASRGEYNEGTLAPVEPALRQKYFDRIKKDCEVLYRVKPELRSAITFRKFNLMNQSYPFKVQLDLILCRNVLIYFDAEDKMGILRRMHRILKPGGLIFVGHSESLMMVKELFTYVEAAVYHKA